MRRQSATVELGQVYRRPRELDERAGARLAAVKGDCRLRFERLVAGREVEPDVVVLDRDYLGPLARFAAGQVVVDVPGVLGAAG